MSSLVFDGYNFKLNKNGDHSSKDNSDGATVCQQRWQEIVVKTSGVLSLCSPMTPAVGTSYVYRTSTMAMRHPQ